VKSKDTNQTT